MSAKRPDNPYHYFLKIAADGRTPDHYELLGLPRFTDDAATIKQAAIRRSTDLRGWDNSDYHLWSNELLDEVVDALLILESPAARAEYDRQLRQQLGLPEATVSSPPLKSETLVGGEPITVPPPPVVAAAESLPAGDGHATAGITTPEQQIDMTAEEPFIPTDWANESSPATAPTQPPLRVRVPFWQNTPLRNGLFAALIVVPLVGWWWLTPRTGWMALPGADPELELFIDGSPVAPERRGPTLQLTVGKHTLETKLDGETVETRDIMISSGGTPLVVQLKKPDRRPLTSSSTEISKADAAKPPKPIDLLKQIEVSRDVVAGFWRFENEKLLTNDAALKEATRLQVPYPLPEEYVLDVTVERMGERDHGFNLGFVTGGRQGMLAIDGFGLPGTTDMATALEMIGGVRGNKNSTAYSRGKRLLPLGEPQSFSIEVRKTGVLVRHNQSTIIDWKGRPEEFSVHPAYQIPNRQALMLAAKASFTIHDFTLTPLSEAPMPVTATDYDHLATGKWVRLIDSTTVLTDPKQMKLTDGILELDRKSMEFPNIVARDVIVRAQVRKLSGQNLGIHLRRTKGVGYYGGWYNGGDDFGIGKSGKKPWADLQAGRIGREFKPDDFVEMTVSVVGDTFALYVEGRQVYSFQDKEQDRGMILLGATNGKGLFKDVEYQILDADTPTSPNVSPAIAGTAKKPGPIPSAVIPAASTPPKADYDNIATGKWVRLVDASTKLPDPKSMKFTDGVLELNDTTLTFPQIDARDVILRAKIQKLSGENVALFVRSKSTGQGYTGHFKTEREVVTGKVQLSNAWLELKKGGVGRSVSGFFELVLSAVGDKLTLYVDGREIHSYGDSEWVRGAVAIKAHQSKGLFKDVEVMVLDPVEKSAPHFRELRTLTGHTGQVNSVAFSADGKRLVSASYDKTVKVWDVTSGETLLTLKGHADGVRGVAISPDGKRLASASMDKTVKVWDAVSGEVLRTFSAHSNAVVSVVFSPDGKRLASSGSDKTVKIWDATSGQETLTLKGHTQSVASVAFSKDGKQLASASGDFSKRASPGEVKVWDVTSGLETRALKGHTGYVWSVAFSPDGKRLASASDDRTVKMWDTTSGQETLTLKGHAIGVLSVAFSPDGKRLASASDEKAVKVWDATSGQETQTLKGHTGFVTSVAFSADGTRLASGSSDRTVKLWGAAEEKGSAKGVGAGAAKASGTAVTKPVASPTVVTPPTAPVPQ